MLDFATDILGDRVVVGDTIVCAFSSGNRATLRVGTVTGFTDRKSSYGDDKRTNLVSVEWSATSDKYSSPETSNIEAANGRFLKITK